MKFDIPKEWSLRMARREEQAGALAQFGAGYSAPKDGYAEASHANSVLGRFVQLLRRKRHMTLEQLATQADVDISELVEIETDIYHHPQPRTIYMLADYFDLPKPKLMEIAGLVVPRNNQLSNAAVRFAANSGPLVELSPEEQRALEEFVKELSN
ncbi:helix-turn-helix transcriptional regulator [Pseudomonas sp. WS 5071]|uniref:helix-turn-helix domain-containing protein n=1 Tax=Pseudomonas sp. WS 5071 TaxID=2717479 RepID=UPI0014761FC1|nr:helix-turn-helix transcriptional regulator [Pseudomonas sp. WS 5071]NMY75634.1 helix-turn-helix transcriptional regulator [Pseudomonas sp. WS 5071]